MPDASGRKLFLSLGCLFAGTGVAAGAFGAHGLKGVLSPEMLTVYETAVRYQMYHALGLMAVGLIASQSAVKAAGWCFVAGILLFSGSLYLMTLTDTRWLGAVTPLGGLSFIAGWLALAYAIIRREPQPKT